MEACERGKTVRDSTVTTTKLESIKESTIPVVIELVPCAYETLL